MPESIKPLPDSQKIHIFLDLDGVIADFERHAHARGKMGENGKVVRESLDEEWWATIPIVDGAKDFYDSLCKIGTVKFLTGAMPFQASFAGKARWVQKFVPERGRFILQDLIICSSTDKAYLARSNHILIDDREQNIREWIAAGGIGILHKGNFTETMARVKAALAPAVKAPSVQKRPRGPGLG